MVAAFAVGSNDRLGIEGCLRLAVGAGAANATTLGAAQCKREAILELAQRVKVEQLGQQPSATPQVAADVAPNANDE